MWAWLWHQKTLFHPGTGTLPRKSRISETERYSSTQRNSSQLSAEEIEALTSHLKNVAVEVPVLSSIPSPSQIERENNRANRYSSWSRRKTERSKNMERAVGESSRGRRRSSNPKNSKVGNAQTDFQSAEEAGRFKPLPHPWLFFLGIAGVWDAWRFAQSLQI